MQLYAPSIGKSHELDHSEAFSRAVHHTGTYVSDPEGRTLIADYTQVNEGLASSIPQSSSV